MPEDQTPLIVIASNRGPFKFTQKDDGSFSHSRGSGGLVTALGGLAATQDVLWVSAAMSEDDRAWAAEQTEPQMIDDILISMIIPDEEQYQQYYNQIANPLLWFVQHQMWAVTRDPVIDKDTWDAWENGYTAVNEQFAEAIAAAIEGSQRPVIVFPQDYHLYLVPRYLRDRVGPNVIIQPFLHIPWPGPDGWRVLPRRMRDQLLTSMLQSDAIGFQTKRDAFNFVQTCRFYLEGAHSRGSRDSIEYDGRVIPANDYPISIDAEQVEALVDEQQTRLLKSQLMTVVDDRALILRVDRIEPSKNIIRSVQAMRSLLENFPEHQGKVQMLMLLVPSRMEVNEYQNYLRDLMAETGTLNAEFSDGLWEPVRLMVGDNYHRALAAMQLYDVLMVNPIADGMNLVAKEGALVNQRSGVILLSEHAGAIYELGEHAIEVSSFDVYGIAQAIHNALTMSMNERKERAEALHDIVKDNDVRRWFAAQLEDAEDMLEEKKAAAE